MSGRCPECYIVMEWFAGTEWIPCCACEDPNCPCLAALLGEQEAVG